MWTVQTFQIFEFAIINLIDCVQLFWIVRILNAGLWTPNSRCSLKTFSWSIFFALLGQLTVLVLGGRQVIAHANSTPFSVPLIFEIQKVCQPYLILRFLAFKTVYWFTRGAFSTWFGDYFDLAVKQTYWQSYITGYYIKLDCVPDKRCKLSWQWWCPLSWTSSY